MKRWTWTMVWLGVAVAFAAPEAEAQDSGEGQVAPSDDEKEVGLCSDEVLYEGEVYELASETEVTETHRANLFLRFFGYEWERTERYGEGVYVDDDGNKLVVDCRDYTGEYVGGGGTY